MSSYKVVDLLKKKSVNSSFDIKLIKEEIINHLSDLFKVTIIKTNYNLSNNPNDNLCCEVIGYDDSYQLVIFEFRKDKEARLINNGLLICDYIKEHPSVCKVGLKDYIVDDDYINLIMEPRLVIIGEDYNIYDYSSIKELPYEIDLVKANKIDNYLIIDKKYQAFKANVIKYKNELFNYFHNELMLFASDISVSISDGLIRYRRICNIGYIYIDNNQTDMITLYLRLNGKLEKHLLTKESEIDEILVKVKEVYENS